ncbi:MAG: hypothetical protein SGBAC_009330 [Bacillariaceae sp.]
MKDASSSYYSRDQTSYSESTRTPYIQEDDSMMTYYTDESMERRQNKKLTYDTFIPMESDSSRGSTSGSGRPGWRKEGLSIDTRNDVHSDDEADEAAKKALSPGMADTENIRNKRRQRLARMARIRNERQEADDDEDEENYERTNYTPSKSTVSPTKPSRYVPSPVVEEPERSFSVSPRKHSRYGSTPKGYVESPSQRSTRYIPSSAKGRYSGSRGVLSPQSRSTPQNENGQFEPYKTHNKVASPDYGRQNYNFDFQDDDDDADSDVSRGGSSNETRASSKRQEDDRENRYQNRRHEAADTLEDRGGDDRPGRYQHHSSQYQDNDGSSTLDAKPSDDSEVAMYSSSPKKRHEIRDQRLHEEDEHSFSALTKSDSDVRVERRDAGYDGYHASAQRDEQRDEVREDYDSTPPYRTSNHREYHHDHESGRDSQTHHLETRDESQVVTYQGNAGNDKNATTPAVGRYHPSQNPERRRYAPEPSPREAMQAHMAQAYMSPHGYHNPENAAMANHNARHALLKRYGSVHNASMHPPMPQHFGPMQSPMHQHFHPPMQVSTPPQHPQMRPPMPQQYQSRTQTTRNGVLPVVEDDSGRSSGRSSGRNSDGRSPFTEDRSHLTMESHSILNASVNTGAAGCQAIQCQSVMTKIWTCGNIGDVDDFDPRTRIFEGLAGEPMAAFSIGAGGRPQRRALDPSPQILELEIDTKANEKQNDASFPEAIVGAIEKISAEAQFLGAEATHLFSDVINGKYIPTEAMPEKTKQQPMAVKSYGDVGSGSSSDSSSSETEFEIGGPSEKKVQPQEKKSGGVRSKQNSEKAQIPEVKPDVTEVKSPSNGIYASVIKGMDRREQVIKLQKGRQNQKTETSTQQETEEFVTGTDQLRDVYKQLFDTMESPMNEKYLKNAMPQKKKTSTEKVGTKETGIDGATVFHSFEEKPKSDAAVAVKEQKAESQPVEEKEKAVVSGILSALENTLAQMMLPNNLSEANVEESVIGSIGGEEQDLLLVVDDKKLESVVAVPPEVEAPPISTQVMNDLLQKTKEQKSVASDEVKASLVKTSVVAAAEQTGASAESPISTLVMNDLLPKTQKQKVIEFDEVEATATMTDADIEAELVMMLDDESVASTPDSYDGPTDNEIVAELMGGIGDNEDNQDNDGQDNVKSMFDDATVDDDETALSVPSAYFKPKVHVSREVSQLKVISEDTSNDLESLKRAAKALEEAINKATAAEVQRMNTPAGELPASMSDETGQTFTTAVTSEMQEEKSSWMRKMWK